MNIKGKRVTLRAIEREDLSRLHYWSNDPEIQTGLGGWHLPSSSWQMERWWQKLQSDQLNQRFAIDTPEHGLIGMANLVAINWKDRNAFHGLFIGDEFLRGQGYGSDTVMAVMRYSFEELGLERLDTTVIEYNQASLGMYTGKCGWKQEGRKRNCYYRQGRYWDQIIIGINRDEYYLLLNQDN
ncbi:GNAT family N-acetyltransferase [Syntrophomonas curvata]